MRRLALTIVLLSLAASAHAQCQPIVVVPGMEGGGNLPAGKAGWYRLREQALGIPVGNLSPEVDLIPAVWLQLPGVALAVDPDWSDARSSLSRTLRPNSPEWAPECSWQKAKEWMVGAICDHGNPLYETCKRFPGACAVRIPSAIWAKAERCHDGYCWHDCTGYAQVWALDESASRTK